MLLVVELDSLKKKKNRRVSLGKRRRRIAEPIEVYLSRDVWGKGVLGVRERLESERHF